MFFFKKKGPFFCDSNAIIKVFEVNIENDTMIENMTFLYFDKTHKVGVNNYEVSKNKRVNNGFYLDDQVYMTLEEFLEKANIDGVLFTNLGTIQVTKSEEHGHPTGNGVLAKYEIKQ